MKLSLLFVGIISAQAAESGLRVERLDAAVPVDESNSEHLDLEIEVDGERQLFPLLPGTRCPTGHTCRTRTISGNQSPMINSLKGNIKTNLAAHMDWIDLNHNLNTVVMSDNRCSRRQAMARAAGLAAGVTASVVASPAYAAETKEVLMGSDSGLLAFVPQKITVCAGDSVKWINNKSGPHNVVFDEEGIPAGVDQEKISMIDEQLGEEGESFVMKFATAGEYAYYCEPHRGAGMQGVLVVT
mmetsp:Transcript_17817/g.32185  ORF Transcript_17817/g.32185 Transcript_17817/m.32185 type:complete len:242 (+) Transcript_17817:363-1088(+)|eukprot:CAMPEP_0201612718 /NCGR_PEP_ID=MMETSP0492-20130828/23907_1 /ASSEMBLY_ACC=CAM_ASM_000837 /TAXON_ID=420259 /ORGANISM="Thalassiosira gravida, Strain GMp14c1" /LENGTH=241 /DNA_ID=CAMNT_0048079331 /DNA_START=148 /DNA_END=873 /DNA_ORIENTATION=+